MSFICIHTHMYITFNILNSKCFKLFFLNEYEIDLIIDFNTILGYKIFFFITLYAYLNYF